MLCSVFVSGEMGSFVRFIGGNQRLLQLSEPLARPAEHRVANAYVTSSSLNQSVNQKSET